jgi:hypothetical protein
VHGGASLPQRQAGGAGGQERRLSARGGRVEGGRRWGMVLGLARACPGTQPF